MGFILIGRIPARHVPCSQVDRLGHKPSVCLDKITGFAVDPPQLKASLSAHPASGTHKNVSIKKSIIGLIQVLYAGQISAYKEAEYRLLQDPRRI